MIYTHVFACAFSLITLFTRYMSAYLVLFHCYYTCMKLLLLIHKVAVTNCTLINTMHLHLDS